MALSGKLERQLNLMATLLETPRPLTRNEIRERVEGYPADDASFRRAFERDKDELREMGVPLELAPIQGRYPVEDGYRIPADRHYLRDPGLTPEELAALNFAASAVRMEGEAGAEGLRKLGGRPLDGTSTEESHAIDVAALPLDANLVQLFEGVAEHRAATFTYNGERRRVDPYRLEFLRGHWYLTAYDHLRDEERNFRVDRIDGDVALGSANAFQQPSTAIPGARVQPWQLGAGDSVIARVRIDADQVPIALAETGDDAITETGADGSVVLELAVTNIAGFRTFVLGFLEHAEVLSPLELRAEIVSWLESTASA